MEEIDRAYVLSVLEGILAEAAQPATVPLTDAEGRRLPLDAWFQRRNVV